MSPDQFPPIDFAALKLEKAVASLLHLELRDIFDLQETLPQYQQRDIAAEYIRQDDARRRVSQASFPSQPSSQRTSYLSASSLSTNSRSSISSNDWDQSSFLARASSLQYNPSYANQPPFKNQTGANPPNMHDPYSSDGQRSSMVVGPSNAQQSMHEGFRADTTSIGGLSEEPCMVNSPTTRFKHMPNRLRSKRIPCPEIDCNANCTPLSNFEAHMKAAHTDPRRIRVYKHECKHSDAGQMCSSITYTTSDWGDHHKIHQCGNDNVNCRSKSLVQYQKLWPCGICQQLFKSFDDWLPHYGHHFTKENFTEKDVNVTNVILGLLEQPKTQAYWHEQRKLFDSEFWPLIWTWAKNRVQVRSAIITLSYAHFEDQILEDSLDTRALVDKIIDLSEAFRPLPNGLNRTPPKRRATSSPSKFQSPNQGTSRVYEPPKCPNSDAETLSNEIGNAAAMDGGANQY